MTDLSLIKRAQKGDDDAFYALMQSHKDQLYKIAYSYLGSEIDALEAIQEVTYRAYKSIKKLKEPQYFSTWLIRILINYCIDERKRNRLAIVEIEEIPTTKEDFSTPVVLDDAIRKMNPNYRKAIILKFFQDFTYREIAHILNRPEGTIKTWVHQALIQLRKTLGKEGEEDYV